MSFESFELDSALLAGVRDMGFSEPTDIQSDAIPWALEGRDLLACAMTGSGKTAAFALPILQRLLHRRRGATRALVLSPTRELALQSEQHFRELGAHTDMRVAPIFGGVGYEPQERAFREGYDVLVATPGRLLDHLRRPYANLDQLEVLVLDEADRMLDMGFIPDVRRIVQRLPRERQTLLFSATLATPIVKLAGDMLHDPVTINLERRSAPAEGVRQAIYPVRHELKPALLLHLLKRHDVDSALVFTRTKDRADLVGEYLRRAGISVAVIHGDRTQQHRTRVMEGFKEGRYQVLVATDVAARGIDIEELSHVINVDVPNQPDDYIHRVGRTARAGSTGDAFTFVAARELADLHLIEKTIGQKLERIRLEDFDYSPAAAQAATTPSAAVVEAAEPEEEAPETLLDADADEDLEDAGEDAFEEVEDGASADEAAAEPPLAARPRRTPRAPKPARATPAARDRGPASGDGPPQDEDTSSVARFAALRARRAGRSEPVLSEERSGRGASRGRGGERREEGRPAARGPKPRQPEPQRSEPRRSEPQRSEPRPSEPRHAEPRRGDSKRSQPRRPEARSAERERPAPAARGEDRERTADAEESSSAVARFAALRKRHRSGRR